MGLFSGLVDSIKGVFGGSNSAASAASGAAAGSAGSAGAAAGYGALAQMATSALNAHLIRQNATHNATLARENWIYQQSNAHQLEVEDLRKAGLNPILSATNSQLASMGSVSGSAPSDNGIGSAITSAIASLQIAKEKKEVDLITAQSDKLRAETDALRQKDEADNNLFYRNKLSADTNYTISKTLNERAESLARVAQISQDTANSVLLVNAQVHNLEAGASLSYAQIQQVDAMVAKLREDKKISAETAIKLHNENQVASNRGKFTKEWYDSVYGEIMFKAGLGFKDLLPFAMGFSSSSNGTTTVGGR